MGVEDGGAWRGVGWNALSGGGAHEGTAVQRRHGAASAESSSDGRVVRVENAVNLNGYADETRQLTPT
jgi:hypothetical protein